MRSAVLLCFVAADARKPSYDEQLSSYSSTFAAECTREKLDQYAVPGAPAVRDLLQPYLKMSPMGQDQRVFMLSHLKRVLDARVPGAVLELGAREGGTSLLFRRMLDAYDPAGRSGRGVRGMHFLKSRFFPCTVLRPRAGRVNCHPVIHTRRLERRTERCAPRRATRPSPSVRRRPDGDARTKGRGERRRVRGGEPGDVSDAMFR